MKSTARDSSLNAMRLTYVLFFAGIGTIAPFLSLHFQRLGFSGHHIGMLNAIPPLVTLFGATVWAVVADRLHIHKHLLKLLLVGAALSVTGLSFVHAFGFLLVLMGIYAFFQSPIPPLLDTAALEALGPHPERYGSLRLWGSIGFILATWVLGALIRRSGVPTIFFYAYAACVIGAALASTRLPEVRPRPQPPLWVGLSHFVRDARWVAFLVSLFLLGIANTGMYMFLPLFVKKLGGDEQLVGFAWGLGASTEIPIMWASRYIVERLGLRLMLTLAFALYGLRMFLYSIMWAAWVVLPFNLLHGVTFGLMWVSSVNFANRFAPPGMGATAQGVMNGILFGLSAFVGSLVSGVLYDSVGPARMFFFYGILLSVATVVLWVMTGRADRNHTSSSDAAV